MKQLVRIFTLTIVILAGIAATAQQPRTINFTQELSGIDGKPIPGPDNKPVTLGDVSVGALLLNLSDDSKLSGPEKLGLWDLAHKINKNSACSLSVDEMKTIMDRIGKSYNTVVVGPALHMLDPNAQGESPKAPTKK